MTYLRERGGKEEENNLRECSLTLSLIFIHEFCLSVLFMYVFRLQKAVEVTTAGVPYSPLLTFTESFVNKRGLQLDAENRRARRRIPAWTWSSRRVQSGFTHERTEDDPTGSS